MGTNSSKRNGFRISAALLILAAVCSCTEDINLLAPGDPVPVVYCLLNPDTKEQYVRLGRTFQSDPAHPGNPPLTDSTVWNLPVEVYIEEWKDGLPRCV